MIEILPESTETCIGFQVSGKVTAEDYGVLLPKLDEAIAASGKFNMLVVMGDFNCGINSRELQELVQNTHLLLPSENLKTFPSWNPNRKYDHILISESLHLKNTRVLEHTHSDHLPICVEIELPEGVYLEN